MVKCQSNNNGLIKLMIKQWYYDKDIILICVLFTDRYCEKRLRVK